MQAYMRVCAAIIDHVGASVAMVAGHKEYALPKGRKDDPSFDMVMFRAGVAQLVANKPVAAQVPHQVARAGVVTIDGLNVRSNASAASTIVGVLFKGDKVVVSGDVMNGDSKWLRVGGGYVAARYVDVAVA
jgi:uncharacterized protein YgiM (DUF1202 family)